jgi:hypothetical protein
MATYFKNIEHIICDGDEVNRDLLATKTRKREVVEARQQVMYFMKKIHGKNMSWAKIASFYGKDHATAMHACKTVINLMDTNRQFREKNFEYMKKINEMIAAREYADKIKKESLDFIREKLLEAINSGEPLVLSDVICYNSSFEKPKTEDLLPSTETE